MRTLKRQTSVTLLAAGALLGVMTASVAQESLAPDELRARVVQAISTFEPLGDAAELWAQMPPETLEVLVEVATDAAAAAHLRAGAVSALGHFDADVAERTLRAIAFDPDADVLRLVATRALASLGTRSPARVDAVFEAMGVLASTGEEGERLAAESLSSLGDPRAMNMLDRLVAEASDPMKLLSLHRARGEWLSAFGVPAPAVSLVVQQGELFQERVSLVVSSSAEDLDQTRVRLLTSSLAPAAEADAVHPLQSGLTWHLERREDAQTFWVGVEILRPDDHAVERVIGVEVVHVFRVVSR